MGPFGNDGTIWRASDSESISTLIKMPDVDGALVGGVSLNTDSFTRLLSSYDWL